jgi:hypothetical protein
MNRFTLLLSALVLTLSSTAIALPKVSASIGQGVYFKDGAHATPVMAEVTPSLSFAVVQADLGLMMELNKSQDLIVTPGVRLNLLGFFAKAGVPLRTTDEFDWGVRLGVGKSLFSLGIVGIFVEVDAIFWRELDFSEVVPISGRLGVEIGF